MSDIRKALADYRHIAEEIYKQFPDEDREDLRDTIDGLTWLDEAIAALLREAEALKAMAENGLGTLIAEMLDRQRVLKTRSDRLKTLALSAAQEAGMTKIPAPDFTASIVTPKLGKVVTPTGIDGLPKSFIRRTVTEEPDKRAIAEALGRGEEVGDAYLGNPQPHWTVRR